jgi:type II secretory ATPase GspE/PulE/Tfp pilus assembly ATPase PilB-like protein
MNAIPDMIGSQVAVHDLAPDEAVSRLIDFAADLKVSDLFFASNDNHVAVSARHLGIIRLLTLLPAEHGRHCLSHIKALAGMDVTERRRPLDGRWTRDQDDRRIDLRISTMPTLYGEDIALRILDHNTQKLDLQNLGLLQAELNQVRDLLASPGGLILVTGPTGAGKTTTLYACLRHLNNGERKINTIEDPIEYALDGVRQSQVNHRLEIEVPELLRGVLRQSPDVIMVGEVRDRLTAETTVRAANSGHLVLATLHAPTSAGAVQSMLALGVEPHFLAGCLHGVLAQRLVRTLCPQCRVPLDASVAPGLLDEVTPWLQPGEGETLYGSRGCPACYHAGFAARTGVFEVMTITPPLRELIANKETTETIHQKAVEEGLIEFRQAGRVKVARGETTLEEILRALPLEDSVTHYADLHAR